jgi:lipopolysaccharide transport system permease protein
MSEKITIIQPKGRFQFIDWKEIWEYRELFWTFVKRDVSVRYKQTFIGGLWAILQPFITMVVFSFFFGTIMNVASGGVPYPIFSYSGLILWMYFTSAISTASGSLIGSASLITKVYFPRIIIPLAATMSGLVDYLISSLLLVFLLIYFQVVPSIFIFLIPMLAVLTWFLASGMGLWLSAINVKYRDVKYVVPFLIQLGLFFTPVIYPISIAPGFRNILLLNPMTGLIETHRSLILGLENFSFIPLLISIFVTGLIFISGAFYFKSVEKYFTDII